MRCPLTTRYINTTMEVTEKDWAIIADCHEYCAWWNVSANYNSKTKKHEGECCILTLSKLKLGGVVSTHTA